MDPSRDEDRIPTAERAPYPSSLRHVEFSFRTPQKPGSIFTFDLVVDDGFLHKDELPINLSVLGNSEPLNREFSHLELSGGMLRSALPALLAQATWDPDVEVRVSSIAAIRKLVGQDNDLRQMDAGELGAVHETLRQVFLSPLNSPPSAYGEEHVPTMLQLYERTPAGETAKEKIRVAILQCLNQPAFAELRADVSQVFDVLRTAKESHSRHQLIELLNERVIESSTREERRACLEEQIHRLLSLETSDGADLLGRLRQRDPVYVDSKVISLLLDGKPAQAVKLLGIVAELYRRGTPFEEGLIDLTLSANHYPKVRLMACKSGASEEGLLGGVYDSNWRVREESVAQLTERGLTPKTIRILGRYLELHHPHYVRRTAVRVLQSIPDTTPATRSLLQALRDEDPRIVAFSGAALARSQDLTRAFSYSQTVLSDPDSRLRWPVVAFLSHLDKEQCQISTAFYPLLAQVIASRSESRAVREACAEIIARHAEPEDSRRILGALKPRIGTTMQRYIDKVLEYVEAQSE